MINKGIDVVFALTHLLLMKILIIIASLFVAATVSAQPSHNNIVSTIIQLKQAITRLPLSQKSSETLLQSIQLTSHKYDLFNTTPSIIIHQYPQLPFTITFNNLSKQNCNTLVLASIKAKADAIYASNPLPKIPASNSICLLRPQTSKYKPICTRSIQSLSIVMSPYRTGFMGCSINY